MKKQFKTESKRLLDLMIHSIYTNREIFLRELISNASDALDKKYYQALSNNEKIDKKQLKITLIPNITDRTLTIVDTGIGMDKEALENNLGTIARSGSLAFKQELDKKHKDIDIIGQFGVGFYSAFMVAKKIQVYSFNHVWESDGEDGYRISECSPSVEGTKIVLTLKDNTKDDNYDTFLETNTLEHLVKKYSDYVRYPIEMTVDNEVKVLNSMVPLWKRQKSKITSEMYNDFYKKNFLDFENPLKVMHYRVEGLTSYAALLFIPEKAPFNFYTTQYESGLKLYSSGVFILDNAKNLLPDYFRFVKGIIDSDDLSLNISREILQEDAQVKRLAQSIEKKIKSNLEEMLKNERETYEKFFDQFGLNLKYGIYQDYGMHKEKLQDLILFKSSLKDNYTTLKEYVERLKEDNRKIYYATGKSIDEIKKSPQMERFLEKGIEVLYFLDDVDEFAITMLQQYDGVSFQSIQQGNVDLDTEQEKENKATLTKENQSLLDNLQSGIQDYVKSVVISSRLKNNPVCLVADEGLSIEMEKILAQNPNGQNAKATKILEINPNHSIFKTLQKLQVENPERVKEYATLLYDQALLIEGLDIQDPVAYANKICELMTLASK